MSMMLHAMAIADGCSYMDIITIALAKGVACSGSARGFEFRKVATSTAPFTRCGILGDGDAQGIRTHGCSKSLRGHDRIHGSIASKISFMLWIVQ